MQRRTAPAHPQVAGHPGHGLVQLALAGEGLALIDKRLIGVVGGLAQAHWRVDLVSQLVVMLGEGSRPLAVKLSATGLPLPILWMCRRHHLIGTQRLQEFLISLDLRK